MNEFKNPSMQLCYIDAQKGYISYGDETSEKILLELLKDRISESDKSILQISLNEAVKVAPLLMKTFKCIVIIVLCKRNEHYGN